jgi:hypothetical protein
MTDFYRLVEKNDNEGETWLYYFPADKKVGNALELITNFASEEYEFDKDDLLEEDDVDFLVDHLSGLGGYKSLANKVIVDPEKVSDLIALATVIQIGDLDEDEAYEAVTDLLYKGSLFK